MNKQLVPKIRFKEFEGEWGVTKLSSFVKLSSGGTPPKNDKTLWDGDIPWISGSSLGPKYLSSSKRRVTEAGSKKGTSVATPENILILVRGSMLFNKIQIGIPTRTLTFNQDVKSISITNTTAFQEFLYYSLRAKENYLLQNVVGTGIGAGKLSTGFLLNLKVNLPTLPEQQKIAAFLSLVDRRLAASRRRVAVLEEWKRGVMQELFATERILDAEWSNYKVADVFDFVRTNSLSRAKLTQEGSVINVHYGDVHKGLGETIDLEKLELSSIDQNTEANLKAGELLEVGDLIIADASEDYADIGKCTEVVRIGDALAVAGLHTIVLRDRGEFVPGFKSYLFLSPIMRRQIARIANGVSVLGISKANIGKLSVYAPPKAEQARIANILTTIDARIAAAKREVDGWEAWKRGLLQGMLV